MVVITTYRDETRARRMRDWLLRSHIAAQLRRLDDGFGLAVRHEDEHRAVELLFTLALGLEADRLTPQPPWRRITNAENAAAGLVAALGALLAAVGLAIAVPAVPLWVLAVAGPVALVAVAVRPGRTAEPRPVTRRRGIR